MADIIAANQMYIPKGKALEDELLINCKISVLIWKWMFNRVRIML